MKKMFRYCPKCNTLTDHERIGGKWQCLMCAAIKVRSRNKWNQVISIDNRTLYPTGIMNHDSRNNFHRPYWKSNPKFAGFSLDAFWFNCLFHFTETIVTIHGPIGIWNKWNRSIFPTSGTFHCKRLSGGRCVVYVWGSTGSKTITFRRCLFSFYSTWLTAFRRINMPYGRKLFLLFCSEGEVHSAVMTCDLFVSINHWFKHPFCTRLGRDPKPEMSIHLIN